MTKILATGNQDERSEELKRHWLTSWPDYDMPTHEDPPCDRDGRLPEPEYGRP